MSTRSSIKYSRDDDKPGYHLFDDVVEVMFAEEPDEAPVYLEMFGVEAEMSTAGYALVTLPRAMARELGLLPPPVAQPPQAVQEVHVEGFLCRAWGETDLPEARLVRSQADWEAFVVEAQWGSDSTYASLDAEDREAVDAQVRYIAHDMADNGTGQIEFEIGGISVERVTFPIARAAMAVTPESMAVLTELVACKDIAADIHRRHLVPDSDFSARRNAAWDRARTLVAQPPQAVQEVRPNHKQNWPKEMRVGRLEDMSPDGKLEVMLDGDSDVIVAVSTGGSDKAEWRNASVEFCTVGMGGGSSPRTRAALIDLMHAIEADNAETPRRAWPPKLAAISPATKQEN